MTKREILEKLQRGEISSEESFKLLKQLKQVKNSEERPGNTQARKVETAGPAPSNQPIDRRIAVIGMACHFPDAKNKQEFWENLKNGKDSIREVPPERWSIDELYRPEKQHGKVITKWGGYIEGIEYFDPAYFGLPEDIAPEFDPLIRQALEVGAETFLDAGYTKKELSKKRVGVYIGTHDGYYKNRVTHPHKDTIVAMLSNFIGAHLSHCFNLIGPNMTVDTACSSSLLSTHLAIQGILSGDCDMALAGGVDILTDESLLLILSQGGALSPDGRCYTFDEKANGFVPGEGAGAILLKPYTKAVEDGDQIYGVILGTAANNDGRTMGITTPNPTMQVDVIEHAQQKAGIDPATIGYVEAHGTGTLIGDPIELKALTKVFSQTTDEKSFCAVGSVKTNIGHLLTGAGIAGTIKIIQSLVHKQIPPTLNCDVPNPRFKFSESPFYPNTTLTDWEPRQGVRRAGISGFGFGGTNVHMVLEGFYPEEHPEYTVRRQSLPMPDYNKKRYWLEKVSITEGKKSANVEENSKEREGHNPANVKPGKNVSDKDTSKVLEIIRIEK